jgi:hypothetical protein
LGEHSATALARRPLFLAKRSICRLHHPKPATPHADVLLISFRFTWFRTKKNPSGARAHGGVQIPRTFGLRVRRPLQRRARGYPMRGTRMGRCRYVFVSWSFVVAPSCPVISGLGV